LTILWWCPRIGADDAVNVVVYVAAVAAVAAIVVIAAATIPSVGFLSSSGDR
jgi:hypothetical protein